MLYLNYLFLIFEWSACKLAGQAKCSFHCKHAFNLFFFFNITGPSNALIIKDVKPGDAGIYSCIAENILGRANASTQLTVQCKFLEFLLFAFIAIKSRFHNETILFLKSR